MGEGVVGDMIDVSGPDPHPGGVRPVHVPPGDHYLQGIHDGHLWDCPACVAEHHQLLNDLIGGARRVAEEMRGLRPWVREW